MIPIPPTSKETEAILASNSVMILKPCSPQLSASSCGATNHKVIVFVRPEIGAVLPEECANLFLRETDVVFGVRGSRDTLQPIDSGEFLLDRRVRHKHRVVLILPEVGSLGNQLPDDDERNLLNANGLSNGILLAEQLLADRRPNDANIRCHVHVSLGKSCRRGRLASSEFRNIAAPLHSCA